MTEPAELVWRHQSVWSQAADAAGTRVERARQAMLALGVAGAVLGTTSGQLVDADPAAARGLALGAAVTLALIPIVARRAGHDRIQDWIRLRAVSEELKAELYTFLAGAGPYRDTGAGRRLLDRTDHLTHISDLRRHTGGITPAERPLPAVFDVDSYIPVRVQRQIDSYYRPRAADVHRRLRRVRVIETALAMGGAVLGVLAGFAVIRPASAWVGVITTITGSLTAHVAASRWAHQEVEYQRSADQLERLLARRADRPAPTAADDDRLVADCERVISIQNEGWMARWSVPVTGAGEG